MPYGAIQKPVTQAKYYPFNGGLDVVTPPLSVDPGFLLTCVNFEPWYNGGYRRVDGFERFDGHAKPSAAVFYGVQLSGTSTLTQGTGATSIGTGAISGATAQIVESVSVAGVIWNALTNVSGTFVAGEKIVQTGGTSTGTLVAIPSLAFAPTGTGTSGFAYNNEFLANAQNFYRQQIAKVPGFGNVLGAWQNGTNVYGWRGGGTSAGTAAQLYLASGTGWTQSGITYCATQYYTGGTGTFAAGTGTVKGATSGATGSLYQQVEHSPSAGYVAITGSAGTFTNNETLLLINGTSTGTIGTAASASTTFAWPVGGHYRFKNNNFFGGASTYNTFGCNGIGPAFQIDQSNVIMPILLPLNPLTNQPVNNNPFLIEAYQNFLFLAFPGGGVQCSVQGVPYQYNGFLGAAQLGLGAEVTGMNSIVQALVLTTQHNTQVLTGTSVASFQLNVAAEKAGAQLFSAVLLDTVYALNNLGITSLSRTQSYGNFVGATVSQLVQPIVQSEFANFVDASIVRKSNQFRVYFGDTNFLIGYVPGIGQQNKAWSAIESGVVVQFGLGSYSTATQTWPIFGIWNSEDQNNMETSYFGSSNGDGYVYQDRSGTSFDGNAIAAYMRLVFNNVGSPSIRKFFRRADIEVNAASAVNLSFVADIDYGPEQKSGGVTAITAANVPVLNIFGAGGYWDQVNWNQFYWDGQSLSYARATLNGTGQSISFLVYHTAIVDQPFVMQGLTLYFDPRRLTR